MKRSSIFYAIFFLLLSPLAIFAVDINLTESPSGTDKAVSVEMDTKGEMVNSFKVAIEVSDDVNVSKIEESDYACGTFSSSHNGSIIEITCTTKEEAHINSSIAKILFTTDSTKYSFKVLADQSQIGDLSIEKTADIGGNVQETNSETPTTTSEPTTTSQPTTAPSTTKAKEKKLTDYLPYALLGVAGVLLLSIIVLLVTKGKKDGSTTTTAHVTQPPITTEPEETEAMVEKPTLQEMVNAGTTETVVQETPAEPVGNHEKDLEAILMSENPGMDSTVVPTMETTTMEAPITDTPMVDPLTTPIETTINDIPVIDPLSTSIETTTEVPTTDSLQTPMEAPITETTMVDSLTTPVEAPINDIPAIDPLSVPVEVPVVETTPTTDIFATPEVDNNEAYVANTSQGGLPSIGFTSPAQSITDMNTATPMETPVVEATPSNNYQDIYATPTETPVEPVNTNFPAQAEIEISPNQEAMDLQALVNGEVNNISTGQPETTTEPVTTTQPITE